MERSVSAVNPAFARVSPVTIKAMIGAIADEVTMLRVTDENYGTVEQLQSLLELCERVASELVAADACHG
jgi:hypothetical protein